MVQESNGVLLALQCPTIKGFAELRKCIDEIPASARRVACSSVYKKYLNARFEDLNSVLTCVFHIETSLAPRELHDELILCRGTWHILSFGTLIALAPDLPIPNPILYDDKAILRCASEAWGSFEHPILGQSLNELVRSVHAFENVEFFAQGKGLI